MWQPCSAQRWSPREHCPPGAASRQPVAMLNGQHSRCPSGPSIDLPMSSLGTFGPRPLFLPLVFPFPLPLAGGLLGMAGDAPMSSASFVWVCLRSWSGWCPLCQRQHMETHGWLGEHGRQHLLERKSTRCISFQRCNVLCHEKESCPVCTQNLDQGSAAIAWWGRLLQVLEQFTLIAVEDLVLANAHQVKGESPAPHCLEEFQFSACL